MAKSKADIQAQIEKLQAEMAAMNDKKKELFSKALFTEDFVNDIAELSDADLKTLAAKVQESTKKFVEVAQREAKKAVEAE